MRNKLINLGLLMTLLFISACGQGGKPASVSFMVFGEPAELKAYQNLVDAFQKQNTDVPLNLFIFPARVIIVNGWLPIWLAASLPTWC